MRRLIVASMVSWVALSCSSAAPVPEVSALDARQQGGVIARAVAAACGNSCSTNPVYVPDQLVDVESLTPVAAMPIEIIEAVSDVYPDARFVDIDEAEALMAEVDAGRAVMINLTPPTGLAPGVAGVDIAVASRSVHGQTIQFKWDGSGWPVADSDDTGVTVTSFVF